MRYPVKLVVVVLFAVAMAYLESAVVAYLRGWFFPDGFRMTVDPMPHNIMLTEIGREAATIVMLVTVTALGIVGFPPRPSWTAPATVARMVKAFEERRAELEAQAAEKLTAAETRKAQIEALSEGVTIRHRAGEEGRLFGSVGLRNHPTNTRITRYTYRFR